MRPPELRAFADELIVDSFAGGGGASLGIEWATGRSPDIAINHDAEAIALHAANHAGTKHYQEDVWKVDPLKATGGRPVGLMWLSPDCKHFSKAKGGKPVSKKVRGLAWVAVRWAKAVRPRVIVLENVEEFQTWGPLGDDDRPCPRRKGRTFRMFVGRLRALGYEVQHRELRACDFGAPTIRKRLFLIARCDGQPIVWPKATHGKGTPKPWRTAAECIDWSVPCPSIFATSAEILAELGVRAVRPLAIPTLKRIARGLRRYVIECAKPFLVEYHSAKYAGDDRTADIDSPLPVQSTANRFGLVVPYITKFRNGATGSPIDEPLPTVTANSFIKRPGGCVPMGLVSPVLIQTGYGERDGQQPRSLDIQQPIGTLVSGGKHALVSAFLAEHYGGFNDGAGRSPELPFATVTTQDHNAVVTSNLLQLNGTSTGQPVDEPLNAIAAQGNHFAEVRAFMIAYYGNEKEGGSLFDPVRTVTSKDRLGLVTIHGTEYVIADIGMRMLIPRELYRAQGFPDSYRIDIQHNGKPLTKTAQVRMVGNSVSPEVARAIVAANCAAVPTQELVYA